MEINVISLFLNATLVVKCVILILVVMSLISWTIIFYKLFLLLGLKKKVSKSISFFDESKSFVKALNYLKEYPSPVSSLAFEVLRQIKLVEKKSIPISLKKTVLEKNLKRALDQKIVSEVNKLFSGIPFLATCTNSAPFIGLFGTVWGIMHSFHSIGFKKSASLAVVAPGIAEALIATAIGLAVAVPASMAYNFFLGVINSIEDELNTLEKSLINRLSIELVESEIREN